MSEQTGIKLLNECKYKEAIEYFSKINTGTSKYCLSFAHFELNNYKDCLDYAEESIKMKCKKAYWIVAALYLEGLGVEKDMYTAYKYLELCEDCPQKFIYLGHFCIMEKHPDDALMCYENALGYKYKLAEFFIGITYKIMENYDLAKIWFHSCIEDGVNILESKKQIDIINGKDGVTNCSTPEKIEGKDSRL